MSYNFASSVNEVSEVEKLYLNKVIYKKIYRKVMSQHKIIH